MATNRAGRLWTPAEIEKLEDMVGLYSFEEIGKKLGRTALAVERKLTKLGLLDTKINAGLLSLHEVSKAMNVDSSVVKDWKEKHDFPLFIKHLRYTDVKQNSYYVEPEAFWKWVHNHKHIVNLARYERGSIIPEPPWLNTVIKYHTHTIPKNRRKLWTAEEDNRLWYSRYQLRKSVAELAEEFGRSKGAIQRRLEELAKRKMLEAKCERCGTDGRKQTR